MAEKAKDFFSLFSGKDAVKKGEGSSTMIPLENGGIMWHLAGGVLALVPGFVFSLRQDMPHIFLLTLGIILSGALFFRKGFQDLERPLIYCGITALVLTVIPDMMMPPDERRFGFFDMLIRTTLTVPCLLYLSAMGGFFRPTPQLAGARASLALLGMLICGDRFFAGDFQNTLLGFLDPVLHRYPLLYGSSALLMALFIPLLFLSVSRKEQGREKKSPFRKGGSLLRLFFLLLIPLLSLGGFLLFQQNPELLVQMERFFLGIGRRRAFHSHARSGMMYLNREVNLRRPFPYIAPEKKKVLFYVKNYCGDEAYLRIDTADLYFNGIWKRERNGEKKKLTLWHRMGILSFTSFLLPALGEWNPATEEEMEKRKKEWARLDLYFAALETNGVIPAPGKCVMLDAVADEGSISEEGVLSLKFWRRDGGVTLYMEKEKERKINFPGNRASLLPLAIPEGGMWKYLQVPPVLQEKLHTFLKELESGLPSGKKMDKMSAGEKITLIRNHLLQYEYTDRYQDPGTMDPITFFLTKNKKGHCELFNTAFVLLLRSVGIPARYVRGFYCGESAPEAVQNIVEGHAWCEVFHAEEKCWVTLDATPPSGRVTAGEEFSWFRKKRSSLFFTFRELFAGVRRGYFAESTVKFFMLLLSGLSLLVTPPLLFVTLPILFLLLYGLYRRKREQLSEEEKRMGISPERRELLRSMERWEKRFVKLCPGIPRRKKGENMAYFYLALAEGKENHNALLVKTLLMEYIYLRFRRESVTKKEKAAFDLRIKVFWEKWRKGGLDG